MKAFAIRRPGAAEVELLEVPQPQIGHDELLVRVLAVGVGIHDSYFLPRDGLYPLPIGIEGAGVIEELGSAVSGREPGELIAFVSSMQPKGGTWAEFAAVAASSLIVTVPQGMDLLTAAALPVAGSTALRALDALEPVPAGGTLFISGGSGAIGTVAIQLARQRGWRVGVSASEANHAYLLSLGAECVVDYHDPDWTAQVRAWMPDGVDAAIAVQPGTPPASLRVVRDGGVLVPISGDAPATERGIHIKQLPHQADVHPGMVKLFQDAAAGTVHVEIEQIYPFQDALAALAKVQTRRARGKSVLQLDGLHPTGPVTHAVPG